MTTSKKPPLIVPATETAAPPARLMFTRAYEAALAEGVDFLETFDACWED